MHLERLSIFGIRNLSPVTLELSPGVSYIFGNNGQGKTSLLEAIFLLSHARSFRSATLKNVLCRSGKIESNQAPINQALVNQATVEGNFKSDLGEISIGVKINGGKRELYINEKKSSSTESFIGNLKTVIFTPEDLEIVKGTPSIRRQFIDRVLVMVSSKYTKNITEYAKILKIRNKLLFEGSAKEAFLFNERLAYFNAEILKERLDFVSIISPYISKIYKSISNNEEEIIINYKSNFYKEGRSFSEVEIFRIFEEEKSKDALRRRTSYGIHKDEFVIDFVSSFASGSSREISSQGQIRTKSLACKLASAEFIEIKTGQKPVLLLDDVEGELDEIRRFNLYKYLSGLANQVLITGTKPSQEKAINYSSLYEVINGQIKLL